MNHTIIVFCHKPQLYFSRVIVHLRGSDEMRRLEIPCSGVLGFRTINEEVVRIYEEESHNYGSNSIIKSSEQFSNREFDSYVMWFGIFK